MKKVILLLSAIIIWSCSAGSDGSPTPVIDPVEDLDPVAVNDMATTQEDVELALSNLLDNDTVVDGARITAFDSATLNGGSVSDERTHYLYIPKNGFVGEDAFTYTLCDNDDPASCSTATVTITVTDEGNPVAENDVLNVLENSTKIISNLLANDNAIDDATLISIDNTVLFFLMMAI